MNQKGFTGVSVAILFIIVVLIVLLIPKGKTTFETPTTYLVSPSPSPQSTVYFYDLKTVDDALKNPEAAKKLQFCDQKLTEIPPSIGGLIKTEHLDLSENNLSKLPDEIGKLKNNLRELVLVGNNFDKTQQLKIKTLLPYTRIAFSPQKNFNPYLNDSWESYESNKYGFSFRYHPELLVKETDDGLSIENQFASMNSNAFDSCVIEDAFIKMAVTVEDNPDNLSPIQYIEKIWEIHPKLQGDKYIIESEQERNEKMIKEIKKYKNGDIEGVIADAGESEHPSIISSHNGKIYIFQYLPGGQTGSGIAEVAKQTLEQTISTFKYTN